MKQIQKDMIKQFFFIFYVMLSFSCLLSSFHLLPSVETRDAAAAHKNVVDFDPRSPSAMPYQVTL